MWTRISITLLLAGSLAAQRPGGRGQESAAPSTGTASIAGKVTDSAGAPVKRAVVQLESESRSTRTASRAMTGEDGSFVLGELPKGKYWIVAEKVGYLRGAYRGRTPGGFGDPVEVGDGAAKTGIDIVLSRQGVIAGRVIDEAGEPAERVIVQATPLRKSSSRNGSGYMGITNDLGEFRINRLPPGSYRLLASRGGGGEMVVDKVTGKQPTAEAPTYFPGTIDAASAAAIRVGPGEERTGAEIRLQRSVVVRVAGRVSGELPSGRGSRVSLRNPGESRGPMMGGNDSPIGADGAFEFRNVRPGEYMLTVTTMDRGGPKTMARQQLMVGQQDLQGITIAAAAPPKIDGRLRAGTEPPFPIGKTEITLQPTGSFRDFGPPANARTDETGAFSFPAVSREKQVVSVRTESGIIVKGIYAAGQLLPGLEVDFSVVTGPLEIVLSNKPATITGTVEGTNPDAPRIAVWAIPETEPLLTDYWSTKKVRIASETPTFTLDSLRPGTYRVAAFEEVESDALNDPAIWEQFRARTASVKVGEGESAQVKIKLINSRDLEDK